MFQLRELNEQTLATLSAGQSFPPRWSSLDELGAIAGAWIDRLRATRTQKATGLEAIQDAIDRKIRTDEPELMDLDAVSPDRKLAMVSALHRQNRLFRVYHDFLRFLEPHLRAATAKSGKPARVLELASGYGELGRFIAERAPRRDIAVEVTCSDIVQRYVDEASARNTSAGLPLRYIRLDATAMTQLEAGSFDVIFIVQSIHHFGAPMLARMIAESTRVATTAFVGIDGRRGPFVAAMITGFALLSGPRDFFHDAVLSARKFYSQAELELIARIAAPERRVSVSARYPGYTVLEVDQA